MTVLTADPPITLNIRGVPHAIDWCPTRWHQPSGGASLTEQPTRSPGPTLVFLHGWMLSRAYWRPVIQRLAGQACLSYDLRGFGESQSPADSLGKLPLDSPRQRYEAYAPRTYAADLIALLDRLEIDSAWLVGHSLGGAIALWAAHESPERIQGVICVNSGGGIYLKEEFERFREVGRQLVRWRPRWLTRLPGLDWLFSRDSVAKPVDRAWGRQRVRDFVAADGEAALWTLLESTTETEVHRLPHVVSELPQPVYFLAGDRDAVMPPQYVRHLASFHSSFGDGGENVTLIDRCGHLGPIEQPEAIATQIRLILDRHPQPGSGPSSAVAAGSS